MHVASLDTNAQYVEKLMGDHSVTLELRIEAPVSFRSGDYIEWRGQRFSLDEEPDFEHDDETYVYSLPFYAHRPLHHIVHKDEGAMSFTYVGSALEHLTALLASIRAEDPEWQLGEVGGEGTQSIDFDNVYCIDALTQICEAFGLEWRIKNKTIHALPRIGQDLAFEFAVGQNAGLYSLEVKGVTNQKVTTRLYGKGASINLPANYRVDDIPKPDSLVFDGRYLESNVEKYGVREDVVVFDEIYPRLKDATLTGVTIPVDLSAAISWTVRVSLSFDLNDYLTEDEAQIKFQSGALTGEAFIVTSYNHATGELKFSASDDNGYILPSPTRQPAVGDRYVLLNIAMPQAYIDAAEQELREATVEELVKRHDKVRAYSLEIDPRHVRRGDISVIAGDSVRVKDIGTGIDTSVRIAEVSYPLQNPDKLTLTLSDTPLYASYADKIEADIDKVVQGVSQVEKKTSTSLSFWERVFELRDIEGVLTLITKLPLLGLKTITQLADGYTVPDGGDSGGGTSYHDQLQNLDYPDQHPIAAITGLQAALDAKLNTSSISEWALQTTKPDYAWDEILGKPTTLAGYGITDAMTAENVNTNLDQKVDKNKQYYYLNSDHFKDTGGGIDDDATTHGYAAAYTMSAGDGTAIQLFGRLGLDQFWIRCTDDNHQWKEKRMLWHSGNANLSTVDWTALSFHGERLCLSNPNQFQNMNTDLSIQFMAYRDVVPNIVGAKIKGETYSVYTGGLVQNTDLVFCTFSGISGLSDPTVERMRIAADGTVTIEGNLIVKGTITQLGA